MKSLEEQMSVYLRYHRNPKNRLTHFVGVPLIMFSLFVLLALPRAERGRLFDFSGNRAGGHRADLLLPARRGARRRDDPVRRGAAGRCAWSCKRRRAAGIDRLCRTFVGGWAFQLIGHVFEGKKPALMDNFFQVFIAPIFLMAEVFFAFGYKRDVAERMEQWPHVRNPARRDARENRASESRARAAL